MPSRRQFHTTEGILGGVHSTANMHRTMYDRNGEEDLDNNGYENTNEQDVGIYDDEQVITAEEETHEGDYQGTTGDNVLAMDEETVDLEHRNKAIEEHEITNNI